jgi:hypothetical protein
MYPSEPPFEQAAGRDPGRWQPETDTDGYDRHIPESGSGSRAVPAATEHTRILPAIGTPGRDPQYPGPVSPAVPMSGGPYHTDAGAGYAATTQISYGAGGYSSGDHGAIGGDYGAGHSADAYGAGHSDYGAGHSADAYGAGHHAAAPRAAGTRTDGTGYGSGVTYGTGGGAGTGRGRSASRGRDTGLRGAVPADLRISLGGALAAGGGLLTLLFSFGPFVRYDNVGAVQRLAGKKIPLAFSAWSAETLLAPLTWLAVLAALALVGLAVLRLLTSEDREFLGFRVGQVQVGLALFSFLILVGYALSPKSLVFGSALNDAVTTRFAAGDVSLAWGGSLMVIGSLVAVVGAFLDHLGIGPTVWPPPEKPSGYQPRRGPDPEGYRRDPAASGYAQPGGYPGPYQQRSDNYRT